MKKCFMIVWPLYGIGELMREYLQKYSFTESEWPTWTITFSEEIENVAFIKTDDNTTYNEVMYVLRECVLDEIKKQGQRIRLYVKQVDDSYLCV